MPLTTQHLTVMPSIILAAIKFGQYSYVGACTYGSYVPCFLPFVWPSDHMSNGHMGYISEHRPLDKYCNMNKDKLGVTMRQP